METSKRNTYLYRDIESLRNGSCLRVTGRKRRDRYAHYMNGDFMGFTDKVPASITISSPKKDIRHELPDCMR